MTQEFAGHTPVKAQRRPAATPTPGRSLAALGNGEPFEGLMLLNRDMNAPWPATLKISAPRCITGARCFGFVHLYNGSGSVATGVIKAMKAQQRLVLQAPTATRP